MVRSCRTDGQNPRILPDEALCELAVTNTLADGTDNTGSGGQEANVRLEFDRRPVNSVHHVVRFRGPVADVPRVFGNSFMSTESVVGSSPQSRPQAWIRFTTATDPAPVRHHAHQRAVSMARKPQKSTVITRLRLTFATPGLEPVMFGILAAVRSSGSASCYGCRRRHAAGRGSPDAMGASRPYEKQLTQTTRPSNLKRG